MLNRYTLAGLAILFTGAVLYLLHTSEEERILEQLEQIRNLAELRTPESAIEQLARARELGRYFTAPLVLDLRNAGHGTFEIGTRDELVRRILRGRARLEALELAIEDAAVRIDGETAQVRLLGSALVLRKGDRDPFLERHSGLVQLRREADTWRVSSVRHLRAEPPP